MILDHVLEDYLTRWGLTPDGDRIVTQSSTLLPVRLQGVAAILKIATVAEEKFGSRLMAWWDGEGAARVLAHDNDALLLERADGGTSLLNLSRTGRDDEASRIICGVVAKLHALRKAPLPELIPLSKWFLDLEPAAAVHGGIFANSAAVARALLVAPQDMVVLHGDVHHGNILDFGRRGWLAIDPKGLIGERGFDYANLFCNPDHETATVPGRLQRQIEVVAEAAGLERKRLLQWVLAWAGLSATWSVNDGFPPDTALEIAKRAMTELDG